MMVAVLMTKAKNVANRLEVDIVPESKDIKASPLIFCRNFVDLKFIQTIIVYTYNKKRLIIEILSFAKVTFFLRNS